MLIQKNSKGGRRAVGKLSVLASATKHFGQGNLMSKAGAPAVTDLLSLISATHTDPVYANDLQQGKYVSYGQDEKVYHVLADGTQLLHYQPAATNDLLQSRQFDTSWILSSSPVLTQDQVGIDGATNTAWTIEDDSAGTNEGFYQEVTTASNTVFTLKAWIKKDSDTTRYPACFTLINGVYLGYHIDTQNGTAVIDSSLGGTSPDVEVIDGGDFWIVCVEDTVAVAVTSVRVMFYPARGTTQGTSSSAATGSAVLGQMELHAGKTIAEVRALGPIFTTTAADSTVRIANQTADNSWIDQNKIALAIKFVPRVSTSEASGDLEIFSLTTAAGLAYHDATTGAHEANDGTTTASNTTTLTNGAEAFFGLYADASANVMAIYDGTDWGTEVAYDGAFVEGVLSELARNNNYSMDFVSAKYTARSKAAAITWIEGEAA